MRNYSQLVELDQLMLTQLKNNQWDLVKAAHLLNRAGFGGSPKRVKALVDMGFERAVALFMDVPSEAGVMPAPEWANVDSLAADFRKLRELDGEEKRKLRKEMQKASRRQVTELRGEWLGFMQKSPDPLREKMTLFWHGHFATSARKVKNGVALWRQNDLLRRSALGDFSKLVHDITRDPAMMRYLDLIQSKASKPNENFARELMELFTLGEGHYSENDIKESARAFTGYRTNMRTMEFTLQSRQHDDGEKIFLGQTGQFDGDDVVRIILKQSECARFIARKIWVFFAYESPSEELVDALAKVFRDSGYDVRVLMRTVLSSGEFYSSRALKQQIKSPVQWLVQAANELEIPVPTGKSAQNALRQLGQDLFAPPNVKGWDGGKAWISTASLLFRYNMARALLAPDSARGTGKKRKIKGRVGTPVDVAKIAPKSLRDDPEVLVDRLVLRLFQQEVPAAERGPFLGYLADKEVPLTGASVRGVVHLMMSSPRYQLC